MIDVFITEGIFGEDACVQLLERLTERLLHWTDASELAVARDNAGAFLQVLPAAHVRAGGRPAHVVRVHVTEPEVVLSTLERRRGFIADATAIVTPLAPDTTRVDRIWVTLANTVDGGWGIGGHGLSNAELDAL